MVAMWRSENSLGGNINWCTLFGQKYYLGKLKMEIENTSNIFICKYINWGSSQGDWVRILVVSFFLS